ncbi:MAG: hypothetical protein FD149_8 [Rhodospirillaceae bacterium]|nr:MAG: hypothetical protein FD149_8 [Rhodospirillaceae bacterium]
MSQDSLADRKQFSAEKQRQPATSHVRTHNAGSGAIGPCHDASNEDILKALLAMAEGIKTLVVETMAAERQVHVQQEGAGIPSSVASNDIHAIVAAAIQAPLGEIERIVQTMKDFQETLLPAMSAAVQGTAQAIAVQMTDIKHMTAEIKDIEDASFRGLRKELADMMAHIDKTKTEIAALRPEGADENQIAIATNELDAVIEATEMATSEILEQAETIQTIVENLRDACTSNSVEDINHHIDALENVGTTLLLACGFQDITGQRINKVVNTLLYIEQHIGTMMTIWQIDRGTGQSHLMVNAPDDDRPDKDLLHGPQLSNGGVSQADIDALFD